jgi:hypothetical protein
MATIETLPILIIFVMLIAYMFGSFGVIHTGILHSIAARTYAFETFRHRANLTYFRENKGSLETEHYNNFGVRFHGIANENHTSDQNFKPTQRAISMVMTTDPINEKNANAHAKVEEIRDGQRVRETYAVNPVWVKIQYGICINAKCGD